MTRQLPDDVNVRYDYHEHPTGVSAILTDDAGRILDVGFAKFNHRDPFFSYRLGERIALGRALARYREGRGELRLPRWVEGEPRVDAGRLQDPEPPMKNRYVPFSTREYR